MKIKFTLAALTLSVAVFFASCTKDNGGENEGGVKGKYIINYGSSKSAKGAVSLFDTQNDTVLNGYFESVNGVTAISNYQYAYYYNGKVYFMGNNVDEVTYVDANTFKQTADGIADSIIKPRNCVAEGNTLYVSCWGGDIWVDNTLSYIAKVDLTTMEVTEKIALEGGPEGLEIANGKLYAALNYKDSIAVINLSSDAISYIATPAVSTYFIKDNSDNLYVSLVSSYSMPSENAGLGYVNTITDEVETTYPLNGISAGYSNIMSPNSDMSKIYVLASSWVEESAGTWVQKGSVAVFDTQLKSFESEMFVEGVSGINAIGFDSDKVLVMTSDAVTTSGGLKSYNTDGTFVKEYVTGIAPAMLLTVE